MSFIHDDRKRTKFVRQPNSYLLCSSCRQILSNPVINVKCGHTHCLRCVVETDSGDSDHTMVVRCPEDGSECKRNELVVNRAIQGQTDDLEVYCSYGLKWSDELNDLICDPNGCQSTIKYGNIKQHEETCEYAPVPCPNSSLCGLHRRKSLQKHVTMCQQVPCPNRSKGCQFSGSSAEVDQHTSLCRYHSQQPSTIDASHIERLISSHEALMATVNRLTQRMDRLEEARLSQSKQLDACLRMMTELQTKNEELTKEVRLLQHADGQSSMQVERRSRCPPLHDKTPRDSIVDNSINHRNSAASLSSISSRMPTGKQKEESWCMPFQFKCLGTLRSHRGGVWCIRAHGNFVYSCGSDCCIKIWDMDNPTQGCKHSIYGHLQRILTMTVGSTYLYSASEDLTIKSWNLFDLTPQCTVEQAHEQCIAALACTNDCLFSSSYTVIKVWHCLTLALIYVIPDLHHWVRSLTLNEKKDCLYSGSHGTIEVWDAKVGNFNLLGKISHAFGSVYSLAVTVQYILAGTYNQNIHIYDVKTLQYLKHLSGHVGVINSITVSPSGRFMFSGSSDSSVMVWSLERMLPIQTLQRHSDSVNSIAICGDLVLTGSEDTEIKVFKYFRMQMGFVPT